MPSKPTLERVTGPFGDRYFIAAYVLGAGDDGFIAYAKVFDGKPKDVWTTRPKCKLAGVTYPTAEGALGSAECTAAELIHTFLKIKPAEAEDPAFVDSLFQVAAQQVHCDLDLSL